MSAANEKNEEMGALREELARTKASADELIYTVSHDLAAPFRQIRQLSEFIMEDWAKGSTENTGMMLEKMQGRVRHTEKMLAALLEMSRIGRVESPAPASGVLLAVQDSFHRLDPPSSLELRLPTAVPTVEVEPGRFTQVLGIAIENSIRHGGDTLSLIEVSMEEKDGMLHCSVQDDGQGPPEYMLGKEFRLFKTGGSPTEHVGAGLSIAERIVQSVSGVISLQRGETGTELHFTWPVAGRTQGEAS